MASWMDKVRGLLGRVLSFEAARPSRMDAGPRPKGRGPNAENEAGIEGLEELQKITRELMDSHELMDGAGYAMCEAVVGTGITEFEPDTGDEELNAEIDRAWRRACRRSDYEGAMNQMELQHLFVRELFAVGECGIHHVMAPGPDGQLCPRIELIAAERLAVWASSGVGIGAYGQLNNVGQGNTVRSGVEYDARGLVVAYHVLREHPRDNQLGAVTAEMDRISAEDMEWCFFSRRIEQVRGVPRMVCTVRTVRSDRNFLRDSMNLGRTASAFGVVLEVEGNIASELFKASKDGKRPLAVGADGRPAMEISSGSTTFVPKGTNAKVVAPNLPGPMFEPTQATLHRRIGAGLGLSYHRFSRDSSRSNFASMRGDELVDRRGFRVMQRFVMAHLVEPYRRRVIDHAILTGKITLSSKVIALLLEDRERIYEATASYPGFEYVNPAQEANADATAIAAGIKSPVEACAERGRNFKSVIDETCKFADYFKKKMAEMGLTAEDIRLARDVQLGMAAAGAAGNGGDGGDQSQGDGSSGGDTPQKARLAV